MNVETLDPAVRAVCPFLVRVEVGDADNRSTWTYVAMPEATAEMRAAADNVIATIPNNALTYLRPDDFISRWTNQEYLSLEKKRAADIAANKVGNAKNWDQVMAMDNIDTSKQKVQTLKADLVTDGVLTQVRADEIFGTSPVG
jgi:hypothetical protein